MLPSYLSAEDMEVLETRCKLYAPDPLLIRQYAQEDDCKRFEYSLSQDLPPEILTKRKVAGCEAGFESESGTFQLARVVDIVADLCPQLRPAESFCIVSEPGSRSQVPHTDSIPMEGQSDESWQSSLHYIGALIPLQSTEHCGKTAVIPTSHTNPSAEKEIHVSMNRGDVLVMDGRTTHRGLANTNTEPPLSSPRRICFLTFTLPDVTDGNALAYADETGKDEDSGDNVGYCTAAKKIKSTTVHLSKDCNES